MNNILLRPLIFTGCAVVATLAQAAERPNILIVLLDDLGSNDVGFNGSHDIPTPNIDRIANGGVKCTDGYISAPYSGPSRCGIMSGRYQQRFGAEGNTSDYAVSVRDMEGVPTTEVLLPELLKANGYNTGAIGKWHLGDNSELWPNQRGCDYFYGFSNGGFNFWGIAKPNGPFIQENGVEVKPTKTTYITDDFSEKAVNFIDNNAKTDDPFFLYLAYNAPHAPLQAPQKYLDRTKHIYNPQRSVYAAMILAVDDGLGRVWEALERNGEADNTLIFFLSDNGGVGVPGQTSNTPLRSYKGNMFDGGIKTPYAVYWHGRIMPGTVYNQTVSSLDIYATSIAAAGLDAADCKNPLDGVNLIPYITGKNEQAPHNKLCWRVCGGLEYAIRMGDYKLVKTHYQDELMLFNIETDPIEMIDIAAEHPELVQTMAAEYQSWNAQMMAPRWYDTHEIHQREDHQAWDLFRKKASGNR